jgi:FADH2 O2-dependent halogenase
MDGWQLDGRCGDGDIRIRTSFVVDATGAGVLPPAITQATDETHRVLTSSRAVYAHFRGVAPWADVLDELGADRREHPFPCDAAALHHVIDGGWMWVLRFDNGVTSAGFSLDPRRYPRGAATPEAEWSALLAAYPSIARQFADAQPVTPFVQTGRLQRRASRAAGEGWAMLSSAWHASSANRGRARRRPSSSPPMNERRSPNSNWSTASPRRASRSWTASRF